MWLELVLVCGMLPTNSQTRMTALPDVKVIVITRQQPGTAACLSDQKQKTSVGQSPTARQG